MSISELKSQFHSAGRIEWIGLRPARKEKLVVVNQASLEPGIGIVGDRFRGNVNSKRQVSLIQLEHLQIMESMLGRGPLKPEMLRRNIVISGINLLSLKGATFRLGSAILEMTEQCHPCSRMEDVLGEGGFNLMRGHGGILARVMKSGEISLGDSLTFLHLK